MIIHPALPEPAPGDPVRLLLRYRPETGESRRHTHIVETHTPSEPPARLQTLCGRWRSTSVDLVEHHTTESAVDPCHYCLGVAVGLMPHAATLQDSARDKGWHR